SSDDDVREAEVLPVDRMHYGFLRAPVQHFDVETDELEYFGQVVATALPQHLVLVALPQQPAVVQGPVAPHAHVGWDVITLELANQGVQHNAGEKAVTRQPLDAGDESV